MKNVHIVFGLRDGAQKIIRCSLEKPNSKLIKNGCRKSTVTFFPNKYVVFRCVQAGVFASTLLTSFTVHSTTGKHCAEPGPSRGMLFDGVANVL